MGKRLYSKNMMHPDERREFQGHGYLDVLSFDDGITIGHGVFEPGWEWEKDVKPIAGTETCHADHNGFSVKGTMVVHMDNGDEFRIRAGDAYHIPSGHVAWVEGDETCELIDMTGYHDYAMSQKVGKKAA